LSEYLGSDEMKENNLLLERQICFKLYIASRKMTRLYQPLLENLGLTYPQYLTMLVLWEEGIIDFKDLGQRLDLKTGTLTPIVQKLEKLGHLTRVNNLKDKRKVDICLTKQGKDLLELAIDIPTNLAKNLMLDLESYSKYGQILDELVEKLNEAESK